MLFKNHTPRLFFWGLLALPLCVSADLGRINLRISANIVSPTCVIDSDKDMVVNLPDYPGEKIFSIKLTCPYDRGVKYILSGITDDADGTVFSNTANISPAWGVGVSLSDRQGVIPVNTERELGTVGESGTRLDMKASYAKSHGTVTAGNVQSIIGLTFIYP